MNIGLARLLGPVEYGDALLIINIILIFNVFMTNGLYQSLVKYSGKPQIDLRDLWRKASYLQVGTSAILMLINISIAWPLAKVFTEPQLLYPFILLSIVIPANGLYYCQIGILNGMHKFKEQATASVIYSLARVLLIFILLLLFNFPLYAIIIGTFVAYAMAYFYSSAQWNHGFGTEVVSQKTLLQEALQFIGLFIFITLFMNIDFFILKSLCKDKMLIGQYGAMINVGKMIYFFIYSFTNTFYPISLKLYFDGNLDAIRTKLRDINSILIVFSFVCIIGTYFFESEIIKILFGAEYVNGNSMLVLYCTAIILLSISVLYAHILSVFSCRKPPIYAFGLAMLTFIIASVVLYPHWGVIAILYSFIGCQLGLFAFLIFLLQLNLYNHLPIRYFIVATIITGITIIPNLYFEILQSFLSRIIIATIGSGALVLSSYTILGMIRKLTSNVFPTLNK